MKKIYSGMEVVRAGNRLKDTGLSETNPQEFHASMDRLAYWRGEHSLPLSLAYDELQEVVTKIERRPIYSKRLKRADSIRNKLRILPKMKLTGMQDIAGCRVVVSNNKKVIKIVRELTKKPHLNVKDHYAESPKENGYRSVHLVGRYAGAGEKNFRVELQIRSLLQHIWATGVEMIDICTDQALKSNRGEPNWQYFFKLISELFIEIESIHFLNNLPLEKIMIEMNRLMDKKTFASKIVELVHLERELKLTIKLESYTDLIKSVDVDLSVSSKEDGYYLVHLNINEGFINAVNFFEVDEIEKANEEYVQLERDIEGLSGQIAVLLSTLAIGGIKQAYPNYFADAQQIISYMKIFEALYVKHESYLAKLGDFS